MEIFSEIHTDRTSGSGTILRKTEEALLNYLENEDLLSTSELNEQLFKLVLHFPQFGLLLHFYRFIENHTAFSGKANISIPEIKDTVRLYRKKWEHAQDGASRQLIDRTDLSGKTVLLHSNSSALFNLFRKLSSTKHKPVVWQTWSSPKGEGRWQAEHLTEQGYEVHLFHEDNLNRFIRGIDLAILGTDLVLEDKFLNKSGSYLIALMCNSCNVPLYLLSEQRKIFVKQEVPAEILARIEQEEDKPFTELHEHPDKRMIIHNPYFEYTPLSMVDQVFTE
jgi:translation initiation factor eIF-2B subunit delta